MNLRKHAYTRNEIQTVKPNVVKVSLTTARRALEKVKKDDAIDLVPHKIKSYTERVT